MYCRLGVDLVKIKEGSVDEPNKEQESEKVDVATMQEKTEIVSEIEEEIPEQTIR